MPAQSDITNIFQACIPALTTDIARASSVTTCNAIVPSPTDLDDMFLSSDGKYRIMGALFMHQLELNACQAQQTPLTKFLLANKVDLSKRISTEIMSNGLIRIRPYILGRRKGPINNNYWEGAGGHGVQVSGADYWDINVSSRTGIPVDTRWFNVGERVWTESVGDDGSSLVRAAWTVVDSTVNSGTQTIRLALTAGPSNLPASRKVSVSSHTWTNGPVNAIVYRGTANVSDFESWCAQPPGLISHSEQPFWVETVRDALAIDEQYEEWLGLVLANNPLYANYFHLPVVEYNRQAGEDFYRRFVNTMFFNQPLPNQDINTVSSLQQITTAAIDGSRCVGYKANSIGWYEQWLQCKRVRDFQGQRLSIPSFQKMLYRLLRIRNDTGNKSNEVDVFMPSNYALLFQQALINYYEAKSKSLLRMNIDLSSGEQKSPFGFTFKRFYLDYPNCYLNIITDRFFDDYRDECEARAAATGNAAWKNFGNRIWIIDWSKNYTGILGSNRVVHKTGDLQTLAAVDNSYRCVMRVPTKTTTLMSTTHTQIAECPAGDWIGENIADEVPDHTQEAGDYDDN